MFQSTTEDDQDMRDYSAAGLERLKASQLSRAKPKTDTQDMEMALSEEDQDITGNEFITDPSEIQRIRKLREQKRVAAETEGEFISLNDKKKVVFVGEIETKRESRVDFEEEGEGEEEAFEDYEQDQLAFGAAAVKKANEQHKKELETEFDRMYCSLALMCDMYHLIHHLTLGLSMKKAKKTGKDNKWKRHSTMNIPNLRIRIDCWRLV